MKDIEQSYNQTKLGCITFLIQYDNYDDTYLTSLIADKCHDSCAKQEFEFPKNFCAQMATLWKQILKNIDDETDKLVHGYFRNNDDKSRSVIPTLVIYTC